jgi:hypothetical protein
MNSCTQLIVSYFFFERLTKFLGRRSGGTAPEWQGFSILLPRPAAAVTARARTRATAGMSTTGGTAWQIFASYSPAEVVLRYADMPNPQPPAEPEQEDFEAAIGFVDVSGFTALSENLQKTHGKKGAELLNMCVPCPTAPTSARNGTPG